jgi:hypothetical protein
MEGIQQLLFAYSLNTEVSGQLTHPRLESSRIDHVFASVPYSIFI